MQSYTKEEVLKIIRDNGIQFLRLQFTDVFGILKNVAVMASRLESILDHGCTFDGSSIDGFARIEESDMILMPDINTFRVFPWNTGEARLICDVLNTDGTPYECCPRYALKRVVELAAKQGYMMKVGPELEFFLFLLSEAGTPTTHTHDDGGYFDLAPIDRGEAARRDMCLALEGMGLHIEASHHETARAQHEIDFKYDEVLSTADNVMTFKIGVKTVAAQHGLHATFMPKPIEGMAGSGMHVNISLHRNGDNIFAGENGLSDEGMFAIAGIMKHISSITAVTNQCVNSYKRLSAGYEAPSFIAWSPKNRSPLIRIPAAGTRHTRLELRNPDPACNPYLTFALVLAAAMDGIRSGVMPPAAVNRNIFDMTEAERAAAHIERLPHDLSDAVDKFESSQFVRATLGDPIVRIFSAYKRQEWAEYSANVTQWELGRYLSKY